MKRTLCRLSLLLVWLAPAALGQDDVVIKAMRDELSRSIAQLRLADLDKPYFVAYRINDHSATKISATLGQLTDEDLYRNRTLDVDVRVGDFALDNTNFVSMGPDFGGGCGCRSTLPLDDDYDQIRHDLWLATDAQYKKSAADLAAKRSVLQRRQRGQQLPDFIPQSPATLLEKPVDLKVELPGLQKLARDLSATFRDSPEIFSSSVDIYIVNDFARFINSEGTSFTRASPMVVLDVRASAQANDGQPLADAFRVYAPSLTDLRGDELLARTRELALRLKALRSANSVESYNGPVLFEGEAAAEVVSQVFAPAISAWRFPLSDQPQFESQFQAVLNQFGGSLSDRVGGRVMPSFLDLTDNPRADRYAGTLLLGSYSIDEEGVPSREVKIVDAGIFKTLLANRTPTLQTKASTGSERALGTAPGNLFLTARQTETKEELRKELLSMAQQRGYDYGIIVRHVSVGGLSAFMRLASMGTGGVNGGVAVYKLFADGHEESARAEIAPVPLSAFKDIRAAGDKPGVYHSAFIPFAGALIGRFGGGSPENKLVVVSYVVPSLLFEEVSLKQPTAAALKPPVVPSPLAEGRHETANGVTR